MSALFPAATYPTSTVVGTSGLAGGRLELGQTHIIDANETRIHARLIASRETLLLFTPSSALSGQPSVLAGLFVDSTAATPLGALTMLPPNSSVLQRQLLESDLTTEVLPAYNERAWATVVPWEWVQEGAVIRIAKVDNHNTHMTPILLLEHALLGLGAPHAFQLTSNKLTLFNGPTGELDTESMHPSTVGFDYYPTTPFASLRMIETAPVHWPYFITESPGGARRVYSETERLAAGAPADHWKIIKVQFTMRLEMAHIGLGLVDTRLAGYSSPYSAGTTIGQGWYYDDNDAQWKDLADIGVAAGWTGWTVAWTGKTTECGNMFTHELGHAMTFAHFTEGTAENWGISDEYPDDGQHVVYCCDPDHGSHLGHPWAYDTARRRISSWYRVTSSGVAWTSTGERQGKRDPMNGGEPKNGATCFPQYTPFHARKGQRWAQSKPLPLRVDGVAGWFAWDEASSSYMPASPIDHGQAVLDVEVPTVTIIGSLGNRSEACQIYPHISTPSAPLFRLPSPFGSDLPSPYAGAAYFITIEYALGVDGAAATQNDSALIARSQVDALDPAVYTFSVNLDGRRAPQRVHLYEAAGGVGYPNLSPEQPARLLFTRELVGTAPPAPDWHVSEVLDYGRGDLGNGAGVVLRRLCEEAHDSDCDDVVESRSRHRRGNPTWRAPPDSQIFFSTSPTTAVPSLCGGEDETSTLEVPVMHASSGAAESLFLHVQKKISLLDGRSRRAPMGDVTAWLGEPNAETMLLVWAPVHLNRHLKSGHYVCREEAFVLYAYIRYADARIVRRAAVPVRVRLNLIVPTVVGFDATTPNVEWLSGIVRLNATALGRDSSIFFVVRDDSIGPTSGTWWGNAGPTMLAVPVVADSNVAVEASLVVRAQRVTCNGQLIALNAGRGNGEVSCDHRVRLAVMAEDNPSLALGKTFRTLSTRPLIVDAYNWHGSRAVQATFHVEIAYTTMPAPPSPPRSPPVSPISQLPPAAPSPGPPAQECRLEPVQLSKRCSCRYDFNGNMATAAVLHCLHD